MMFGAITYPMKVSKALFRLGWTPDALPNSMDPAFGGLVRALRSNGVSIEQAASLLDRALQGDEEAIQLIDAKSGLYGMMFFGTTKQRENGMTNVYPKPFR